MIELEHGDLCLVVTEGPAVEPSAQDHILAAAVADGKLKGVFRVSTPDNDEDADRADFGEKRLPEEPTECGDAKYHAKRRAQQPPCGGILKDGRTIVQ
jgi:hypothetical protein